MTSAYKEHVKSLKGPDQFQTQMMTGLQWAVKNSRLLALIILPTVVVIAVFFIFRAVENHRKDTRLADLGKIEVVYDAESRVASDARQVLQKKLQALEAEPAKGAKPLPAAQLAVEKAKLTEEAAAIEANHAGSAGQFAAFAKAHAGDAEGWLAGVTAARAYIDAKNYDEAKGLLTSVIEKAKTSDFYQTQAGLLLTSLEEAQGNYDQALSTIDGLEKTTDATLKPQLLLIKGRLQMFKNAKPEAKQTFTTLIDTYATSAEAQKARSLLAMLNG